MLLSALWIKRIPKGLVVLSMFLCLLSCSKPQAYRRVRLAEGAVVPISARESPLTGMPVRVALAGIRSPVETRRSYQKLLGHMGKKLNRPVEWIQRTTYGEIKELLREGSVDVAFLCPSTYIAGNREFGLELLVAPQMSGKTELRSYIIVPKESGARNFLALQGKTFAFTDPTSLTGSFYPTSLLMGIKKRPEVFFGKIVYTYSQDLAIKAVAEKWVDGAAVGSVTYHHIVLRNPALGARVRIIHSSPPFGASPVVVHPRMDPALKSELRGFFLGLSSDPQGRMILSDLTVDRFVEISDHLYDSARELERRVSRRKD